MGGACCTTVKDKAVPLDNQNVLRPRPPQIEKPVEEVKKVEPVVIPEPQPEVIQEPEPVIVEEVVPEKQRYYSDAPLLTLCNTATCCGQKRFVYSASAGSNRKVLMPLRQVYVQSEISGATAWTNVDLYYHNPSRDTVLRNSSFSFPIDQGKDTAPILTKFDVIIDEDTEVKTEIKKGSGNNREPFEERDALNRPSTIDIKLGNIEPGAPVKISLQFISLLDVVNGHFKYCLPEAFYPDYLKHGLVRGSPEYKYSFKYILDLDSQVPIAFASVPTNSEIINQDEAKKKFHIALQNPEGQVELYYRTQDMNEPVLEFAANGEGKYAVRATAVPTFDEKQEFFDIKWGRKPAEQQEYGRGVRANDFHFVFILDLRSKKATRGVQGAKGVVKSFLNALPQGCHYSIMGLSVSEQPKLVTFNDGQDVSQVKTVDHASLRPAI